MVAHIKHFLDFMNVSADSVNIQFKEKVPTVKVDSGLELTGCAPIGRYIAEQSEKGRTVLGKDAQERALIQQWLEYVAIRCEHGTLSSDTAHSILQELDSYLADRCFFVGISLTLADVFLYYSLHPTVLSLTFKEKEKYGHLCRWFDLVQHHDGLRQNLPIVVFSKTRLYL
ncbi:eukaryotic translation elongation factor 1 epsilon-1 [Dermacentor silvarum]|uniref:eukaryotic translation elongation factor 1 epsilon-1 n=1 Tax=Dermacentor silvarum TaxID=543639 RepID=UPI001897D6AF|nr:eukaryotic translation elongation factor 1 epsilon-1 [Dermacentor silvarum]